MYLPMESTVDLAGGDAQITGGTAIEAKMGTITFRDNAVIRGTGAWNENEPENGGSSPGRLRFPRLGAGTAGMLLEARILSI